MYMTVTVVPTVVTASFTVVDANDVWKHADICIGHYLFSLRTTVSLLGTAVQRTQIFLFVLILCMKCVCAHT